MNRYKKETSADIHPWSAICLLLAALTGMGWVVPAGLHADIDQFKADIGMFASMQDRTTGTPGNAQAVARIRAQFDALGLDTHGEHIFSTATRRYGQAQLSLSRKAEACPLHPFEGNVITPNTIGPQGLDGPLVYAGSGEMVEMNGRPIKGAIVLMELASGRNWLHAASLGAKALIYIDRGAMSKSFFQEKMELSPIDFPRFWLPLEAARRHLGAFEKAADGLLDPAARLSGPAEWQQVVGRNLFVLVPGRDPKMSRELLVVEAFYDTRAMVPGLAPGADESFSVATLLALARHLKQHPAKRSVLLVSTGGHGQTLAGMRELVWSIREKSKLIKKQEKQLKAKIQTHDEMLKALEKVRATVLNGDGALDLPAGNPAVAALHDRIKTEVDGLSRRLMQLRMQSKADDRQAEIQKLAGQRRGLRRLGWMNAYHRLDPDDRSVMRRIVPLALADEGAILDALKDQLKMVRSARKLRALVSGYKTKAVISLHLSSHGDGLGAFNQGWLYALKPNINRVAPYTQLDDVLRTVRQQLTHGPLSGMLKDTLRPSRKQPWQSFLPDRPALGGEVSSMSGMLGITLATTNDMRARWGTPHDLVEHVDMDFGYRQALLVNTVISQLADAPRLSSSSKPRNGFATLTGRANFLRHGELFADQPAPGSVVMAYQGPVLYHSVVDPTGHFRFKGVADKKHVLQKVILEGYRFDEQSGDVKWAIDKKQTGKDAYRLKIKRRSMETDLVMFACRQTTLFNLLEPRTFQYMTKIKLIDSRREAPPLRYWYSRIDTRNSTITSTYLEPDTRLKMTLSDTVLRKKLILLNADSSVSQGQGYHVQHVPVLHHTEYHVARDMWALLQPRIENLERRGIHNQRIRDLQQQGEAALAQATAALDRLHYDRFTEASARAWALAARVYDDVEQTQKDVLFGVLFYIALFVPFSFCLERLLFSFRSIYKRILAFGIILLLLIFVIYNVHPAFQLAYSPTVVILAFFIMGLSLLVTLIIFFRFEDEMTSLQSGTRRLQAGELSRWKAFVAAFLLGISNLRRRRLRTALTCLTLIILTFTIMSFTSVKSSRQHTRLLYNAHAPYQGFLLKNVNWQSLPAEALGLLANAFNATSWVAPRVWLEAEDRTRPMPLPLVHQGRRFEGYGLVGLGAQEVRVTGLDEILIQGRWISTRAANELLLPQHMAHALDIDLRQGEKVTVYLWGQPFEVVGIFSGERLQQRLDLDGEPLTPVTFPRETHTALTEVEMEALESGEDVRAFQSRYEHIAGHRTLIMPYGTLMAAGGHLKGVAVRPKKTLDRDAMAVDLIDRFGLALFSGQPQGTYLYHASDTMNYSGAPNIIIPLVISVFIVLNTMIGSVYERKREIGIYTSVGLAPYHVAFLFVAEALAFAVLSVVLGYLLAQTSAGLLAGTQLWSGITVNYSSLSGVAAMALVILVVLVSVIYPAKVASQIAIPDVNRTWKLPPVRGNQLTVKLPFLLKPNEQRSIGGFLLNFLQSHLDVSHGVFSTGDIRLSFVCHTPQGARAVSPQTADACLQLSCRVWLAPFDLGIMQDVALSFTPVPGELEFLEIHVQLQRQSGEANAWQRINKAFLHHVRRQLLMWRSLNDDQKNRFQSIMASQIDDQLQKAGGRLDVVQ